VSGERRPKKVKKKAVPIKVFQAVQIVERLFENPEEIYYVDYSSGSVAIRISEEDSLSYFRFYAMPSTTWWHAPAGTERGNKNSSVSSSSGSSTSESSESYSASQSSNSNTDVHLPMIDFTIEKFTSCFNQVLKCYKKHVKKDWWRPQVDKEQQREWRQNAKQHNAMPR